MKKIFYDNKLCLLAEISKRNVLIFKVTTSNRTYFKTICLFYLHNF